MGEGTAPSTVLPCSASPPPTTGARQPGPSASGPGAAEGGGVGTFPSFPGERPGFFPARGVDSGPREAYNSGVEKKRGEDAISPHQRGAGRCEAPGPGKRQAAPAARTGGAVSDGASGRGVPARPSVMGKERPSRWGAVIWVVPRAFPSHSWGGGAIFLPRPAQTRQGPLGPDKYFRKG